MLYVVSGLLILGAALYAGQDWVRAFILLVAAIVLAGVQYWVDEEM